MMISVPSFSADYQKSVDAFYRGDYPAALKERRPLAEQVNARAQASLGGNYLSGVGVAKVDAEAAGVLSLSMPN